MEERKDAQKILDKFFSAIELKNINGAAAVLTIVCVVMLVSLGYLYKEKRERMIFNEYKEQKINAETTPEIKPILVHIKGEVKSPGVYELEEGSRAQDAIGKAGGFTDNADVDSVNLAQKLYDGGELIVPGKKVEEKRPSSKPKNSAKTTTAVVSINTGTVEELMTLNGIGEALARRIIEFRESYGKFERLEDIMKVKGITKSKFDSFKDRIKL